MTPINILVTSPTGYIGGSVVSALLHHPRLNEFNISVLVSSEADAARFGAVHQVMLLFCAQGDYASRYITSKADVVIACGDTNNMSVTQAMLGGLKQRYRNSGTAPAFIHTNTSAVLIDDTQGNYASDRIYSDFNIHGLESLPQTQPHREVDIAITEAGEEGYAKTCIFLPGLVYGSAQTCLAGIQHPRPQQIQAIIAAGADRGQGAVIGKGTNIWSHVHIEDLVSLYMHIFDAAICSCRLYVGRNGVYFAENGECELGEISRAVAKALSARGCGGSHPTGFTREEMQKYTFTREMGANARARGERSRAIGWKPVHGTRSLLEGIADEVATSMAALGNDSD